MRCISPTSATSTDTRGCSVPGYARRKQIRASGSQVPGTTSPPDLQATSSQSTAVGVDPRSVLRQAVYVQVCCRRYYVYLTNFCSVSLAWSRIAFPATCWAIASIPPRFMLHADFLLLLLLLLLLYGTSRVSAQVLRPLRLLLLLLLLIKIPKFKIDVTLMHVSSTRSAPCAPPTSAQPIRDSGRARQPKY